MNLIDQIKIGTQYVLPKHLISRLVGKLADKKAGRLTEFLIQLFIKQYQVDMQEAAEPDPTAYKTFNDFFTRSLKEGARPICSAENSLAHPVDGAVSQLGAIDLHGRIVQAKGHDYCVQSLLGGDAADAAQFDNGQFATVYLSPKDYHRIHMPIDGTLKKMIYVPGDLFSVSPLTAEHVPQLFARNERVVALFETPIGPVAMVLVGATIVASVETVWHGIVTPPAGPEIQRWTYPTEGDQAVHLKKGEEMGRFRLGSTIVMCFPKDVMQFEQNLTSGDKTTMGTQMGTIL